MWKVEEMIIPPGWRQYPPAPKKEEMSEEYAMLLLQLAESFRELSRAYDNRGMWI